MSGAARLTPEQRIARAVLAAQALLAERDQQIAALTPPAAARGPRRVIGRLDRHHRRGATGDHHRHPAPPECRTPTRMPARTSQEQP